MRKNSIVFLGILIAAALRGAPPVYILADGKRTAASPENSLPAAEIVLTAPVNKTVVPLLSPKQKSFLEMPRPERIAFFADREKRQKMVSYGSFPKTVTLCWNPSGKNCIYTVTVSEKPDMSEAVCAMTTATSLRLGNLKIAQCYYWCVSDGKGISETASFQTEDVAPRLLKISGIPNARDLGGRKTLDGRRVRQGMIYRNAGLNDNASGDKPGKVRFTAQSKAYFVEDLGIKTDLDLRSEKECAGMTASPAGNKVKWCHISSSQYQYMQGDFGRRAFQRDFRLFLDEKNYPVDFHCIAGQDRTGALAFILNGLLGVPEEELYLDWETTGFWNPSTRFSHARLFDHLVAGFQKYEGNSINEKIEKYVLDNGFSPEDIEKFRSIMLEK